MNADLLDRLLAAGTPTVLVAEVALEIARAEVAASAKAAPSAGALRMRRLRERHAASQSVTSDANVTEVTEIVTEPLALSPNENNSNPHTHTPEGVTPRARKAAWPCPDGVDPQHWADLMANRKAKKLAATKTAYDGQLKKLAELSDEEWPPGRLVQHAAEHGWAAIHDPRTPKDHRNDRSPHRSQDHRFRPGPRHVDGFTAALREVADRAP
ncbi:hypothetical protein GG804_14080 [Sphingomonas histidinilytica]|uniref:hypothetical protein n=1 Tax=Rhizorhabdus histidinilytica TaxID=439228 RepID=UPI001ADC93A4|nr:hypothetical protein [Rhizorhabdus histidinilytica]MBO9377898.1 hypothetical protein [Rhizorhabdus histidinilytica]